MAARRAILMLARAGMVASLRLPALGWAPVLLDHVAVRGHTSRWLRTTARALASLPPHTSMPMPALSPTMSKGTLAKWRKAGAFLTARHAPARMHAAPVSAEGDSVSPGDVLAEVETDKATVDFEAQDSGFIGRILVQAGTADIPVGAVIAVLADTKEAADALRALPLEAFAAAGAPAAPAAAAPAPKAAPAAPAPAPAAQAPAPAAAPTAAAPASGRVVSSPLARKIATDAGLALTGVAGTGPGGRIIAADVREALARGAAAVIAAPAPAVSAAAAAPASSAAAAPGVVPARGAYQDMPHTQMRRVIAHRLTASKQTVPHYTLSVDVSLDAVLALRAKLNAELPATAPSKLSVNDFIIKASAHALRRVPEVNSSWLEHGIRAYDFVDVSVAVAVPEGLITPIVTDADTKGLSAISSSVKTLVEKARAKKLSPEEYQGGTFTVSNLGMFGIRQFSAIINPPQAAILAVGAAERRVVPDTAADAKSAIKQSVMFTATLSCDHRVVDGAVGAQWLAAFKGFLEQPHTLLL